VPFYADFRKWASWGKSLMELHIGYEAATLFALKRVEVETYKVSENLIGLKSPKPKLKADKEGGIIELDEQTHLSGIPAAAWDYKLGNRSALEWVLDQYKEKKPSDPTIAERFNTYRFADYKEQVIDLLMRVCTVSVETQRIIGEMPAQ
jgi:predicted helicase